MTSRLPLALALTGLIGAGIFATGQSAIADETPATQQSEAVPPKGEFKPTPADRAAFLAARIAALHAGLALTPDQEKLWPPIETALRDLAKLRLALFQKIHEIRHDQEHPADPITRLKQISENNIARGEALKKLADAAAPLYATLSDEQKRRLPILLRAIRLHHHHHHFAGNEDGADRGQGWHRHHDQEGGEGWDRR